MPPIMKNTAVLFLAENTLWDCSRTRENLGSRATQPVAEAGAKCAIAASWADHFFSQLLYLVTSIPLRGFASY